MKWPIAVNAKNSERPTLALIEGASLKRGNNFPTKVSIR